MKKIILFILIISNFAFAEDCGWEWVNPLPQGNDLNTVDFLNNDIVFITGENGTLMKSTDAGITWSIIETETNDIIYRYFFNQNQILLIDNNDNIFRSFNGGKNWSEKIQLTPHLNFESYHFFDMNNAICYSLKDSIMLKTSNCGDSWDTIKIPPTNYYRNLMYFFNQNIFFIVDKSSLIKTTDGGINWSVYSNNLPDSTLKSLFFVNENIGWISGSYGKIYKTTDGGLTWQKQNVCKNTEEVKYYKFFDENTGYIFSGNISGLYKTTDGGNHWEMQTSEPYFDDEINSISISDEEVVIGVGNRGIIKRTTDKGYNWVNINTGMYYDLSGCCYIDKQTIYSLTSNNVFLITTDEGNTWSEKEFNISKDYNFRFIKFFNKDIGIINDSKGNFFKTTNAGDDWTKISSISDVSIHDVEFVNEQVGYVTYYSSDGENYIKKTTDGGQYWDHCKALKDTIIYEMKFFDENFGYAACNHGIFFKTTDGGRNWSKNIIDSTIELKDLYFLDENTGWAKTRYLKPDTNQISHIYYSLLKTTNGGNSWTTQIDGEFYITSMDFLNENYGWASTTKAFAFKTTDGGNYWEKIPSSISLGLIHIIDVDSCWALNYNFNKMIYSCTETSVKDTLPISENKNFQIFPNPATNEITFSIPDEQNMNSISIFNSLGMEVKRIEKTELIGNSKITISTADLPSGLYHCTFINQGRRVTKSFVVAR